MTMSSSRDSSPHDSTPTGKKMKYLTFSERYFTPLYKLNYVDETAHDTPEIASTEAAASSRKLSTDQDHVKVLLHSNGICVLTLAPSHPILAEKAKVKTVDFQVSKKVNRLQNSVKGKGKKGGQFFFDDTYQQHLQKFCKRVPEL